MHSVNRILMCVVIATVLGIGHAAVAGPPENAGGPGGERGGPPFGDEDSNPGGGPPDFANNGNNSGDDQEENAAAGNLGGPPGLCGTDSDGPEGRAGASQIAHVSLSQRDEDGELVDDGGWGRMKYVWSGPTFDFVFNAHELEPGDEYVLTYQVEPVGENGVLCLGSGTVNEDGDLHIRNSVELNADLPLSEDESDDGALLVAVRAEDVDCETDSMTNFEPEDYLFTDTLIEYRDTDMEDDEEEEEEEEESEG